MTERGGRQGAWTTDPGWTRINSSDFAGVPMPDPPHLPAVVGGGFGIIKRRTDAARHHLLASRCAPRTASICGCEPSQGRRRSPGREGGQGPRSVEAYSLRRTQVGHVVLSSTAWPASVQRRSPSYQSFRSSSDGLFRTTMMASPDAAICGSGVLVHHPPVDPRMDRAKRWNETGSR